MYSFADGVGGVAEPDSGDAVSAVEQVGAVEVVGELCESPSDVGDGASPIVVVVGPGVAPPGGEGQATNESGGGDQGVGGVGWLLGV